MSAGDQNRNQRPQTQPFVALNAIGLARTNFLVGTICKSIENRSVTAISEEPDHLILDQVP
jgi:hypothetical protein